MEQLLSYLVVNLVSQPDKVLITKKEISEGVLFSVIVAKEDLGKIIGRNGKTISSIRNLLNSIAEKKIIIKIGE